jgi:hypothetical protein
VHARTSRPNGSAPSDRSCFCGPVVGQIWPGQRPAAERAGSRASRGRVR